MLSTIICTFGNTYTRLKSLGAQLRNSLQPVAIVCYSLIIINCVIFYFDLGDAAFFSDIYRHPTNLLLQMFSHGNFNHLFGNMLFLLIAGPQVERSLGSRNFLVMYMLAGIVSSIGFLIVSPDRGLLGASGAISGVLVALVFVQTTIPEFLIALAIIGVYFFNQFMSFLAVFSGNAVSSTAHLSHVFGGFASLLYNASFRKPQWH